MDKMIATAGTVHLNAPRQRRRSNAPAYAMLPRLCRRPCMRVWISSGRIWGAQRARARNPRICAGAATATAAAHEEEAAIHAR